MNEDEQMARKSRIGLRCYDPYVPNEIWVLVKKELRTALKNNFPNNKFSLTEFYWQGFSVANEYIRIKTQNEHPVDWSKIWELITLVLDVFGMKIQFVYQQHPGFVAHEVDTLFERQYTEYSLTNARTWTIQELDEFLAIYDSHKIQAAISNKFNNQP